MYLCIRFNTYTKKSLMSIGQIRYTSDRISLRLDDKLLNDVLH